MRSVALPAAAPSAAEIRELAGFSAGDAAVISLYLNTDGRRYPRRGDFEVNLADLVRQARATDGLSRSARASVESDLEAISDFVIKGFERAQTKSLVFFACAARGLWRGFRLPVPVRDRVVVDVHPHVLRLESLIAKAETYATLLVNRERARLFLTSLGVTAERSEVLDEVPGQHGQGGWSQANFSRHIEEIAHRHFKHVAEVAFALSKREPFDSVVLGGPDEVLKTFEKGLHPWLAGRIAARISLPVSASRKRVQEATTAVQEVVEARRAGDAASRALEGFAAKRGGVVGFDKTLIALQEGRVETLVVGDGEARSGWRCPACGRLSAAGGPCSSCQSDAQPVADLAEEMVDEALRRRCRVVTTDARPLPEGVGALLRF